MAIKKLSDGESPAAAADRIETGLLVVLASEHPNAFTVEEIALQMIAEPPGDFGTRDAVNIAIKSLISAGLARRNGEYVRLTKAAVRAHELLDH